VVVFTVSFGDQEQPIFIKKAKIKINFEQVQFLTILHRSAKLLSRIYSAAMHL